jgi:TetR/AcrR family fatty acid metabolism transcriptional regulator
MNRHSVVSGRGERGDGGAKRGRILDAAVRIFADKGFYNAKVSEIARVAGVADGTIYLYFKSKDDLLISLFEDRMEQVNANVRAALSTDVPPVDKLRRLLQLHLELVEQNPHLAEVLTVELRQSTKFLKEYRQTKFGEFLKLIAEPIEEGQRDGSIRSDLSAPVVARALFGALDELALAWLLSPRDKPGKRLRGLQPSRVAAQLADLFIDGLKRRTS